MKRIWTGVLATAMAGTVSAQAPVIQPKLAELQPNKFAFPLCPLKPQGSVQKGVDALKKAYEPKGDKAAVQRGETDNPHSTDNKDRPSAGTVDKEAVR